MVEKCIKCNENLATIKSGKYINLCEKCRRKQYYLDNKERERSLCKKWYQENRESEIEKNKEYREQNKELFYWYHNKDRFNGMRDIVLERDNNKCQICGETEKIAIHHIDGNGYKNNKEHINNDINNLITLCNSCHHKLHWWQRKNNIILSSGEDIVRSMAKVIEVSRND